MTYMLAIETSSPTYSFVLSNDTGIVKTYDTSSLIIRKSSMDKVLEKLFHDTDVTLSDVDVIAVGIGPGGLSSVRSGVSLAKGLAFSLNIPIWSKTSTSLIASEEAKNVTDDLLCMIKSADGNAYFDWYKGTELKQSRYGPIIATLNSFLATKNAFTISYDHFEEIKEHVDLTVHNRSAITRPHASFFLNFVSEKVQPRFSDIELIIPITEQSREYRDEG